MQLRSLICVSKFGPHVGANISRRSTTAGICSNFKNAVNPLRIFDRDVVTHHTAVRTIEHSKWNSRRTP